MHKSSAFLTAAIFVGSAFAMSSPSLAFCGVIKKTATGPTVAAATQKANNAGLVEVRRLEKNYGNVSYKPAQLTCNGNAPFTCTIKQSFCAK